MMVAAQHTIAASEAASESFFSGALGRIQRFMLVIGPAACGVAVWVFGWRTGAGVACGCAIAYISFVWLKRAVYAFADRIVNSAERRSSWGIAVRFLLRYVLMAAAGYAIFSVSPASLNGLLAGLFLPVAAIACEAGYEVYMALVRGL